ncbi:Hydroquinone glucosyltransferase [Spatholobus suberectus]|nr:Hydroquinone glucosyltransferase [Spatholobus suberectus]
MAKTTHIAVVAGPGFTHLVPILQFSKRLVHLHPDFHVTCIIPSLGSPPSASKTILETLPPNITSTFLPPVSPEDLPQRVANEVQMQLTVTHSLPSIHQTLKSLTSEATLVAMVVDSFAFEALDFAQEFNMLSYVYFPAAATTLSVLLHLPKLDEETSCEYRDLPDPIKVPGCVPLHGRDLYTPTQDRTNLVYKLLLQRVQRYRFVDGMFINSFLEMETGPITALQDEERRYPTMYPVGPLVQTGTGSGDDGRGLECLTWLDKQQAGSVLYVSFGSGGTLSQEQMTELAHGLELSNHKFIWAVRAPNDVANAAYLGAQKYVDPLQFLPCGFLERTKDQGMVVPSWAPQIQILSHSSVGGFLTHCGWNSTLESVLQGVPLITWPLFAEQKMNAVVLSESLKVGVRPKANENGLVEREEIGDVVKRLMEGVEGVKLRNRMKELKEAATNTLMEDGASTKTLSELALKWKNLA